MNEFLQNNLDTISETKSIICYINDIHIEIFDQLDCTIKCLMMAFASQNLSP